MAHKKVISIVSPCYNEENNVANCYETVKKLFTEELPNYEFEHIFSDNSSNDRTVSILKEIAKKDKRVKIIVNSRNYGPFRSMFNAMKRASGDAVIPQLAVDLQDPPSAIPKFVEKWESGYKVVSGARAKREEGLIMRFIRSIFYNIVSRMSEFKIPANVGEFQLIDRVVVDALSEFDDSYPFVRGMIASCGFETTIVEYTMVKRRKGRTKNSLYALFDQALNGIISFTRVPLRLSLFLGLIMSFASLIYSVAQLIISIVYFGEVASPGIQTLIVGVYFFAGVQLFFLGILGEYIGSIHEQVRKRPLVIEKELINFGED